VEKPGGRRWKEEQICYWRNKKEKGKGGEAHHWNDANNSGWCFQSKKNALTGREEK
jgi:hypothetical protein